MPNTINLFSLSKIFTLILFLLMNQSSMKQKNFLTLVNDYPLDSQNKNKISKRLSEKMQYLLEKKRKQNMKKNQIEQLEEQWQETRKEKILKMEKKLKNSDKHRMQLQKINIKKIKNSVQIYQNKKKKIQQEQQREIIKKIQQQKQLQQQWATKSQISKIATTTTTKLNHISHNRNNANLNIDGQLQMINERLNKANDKQINHLKQTIDRIQQKDNHRKLVKSNMKAYSMELYQDHYRNMIDKESQIKIEKKKIHQNHLKNQESKKKQINLKLQMLQRNIKNIGEQREEKNIELLQKLNKSSEVTKTQGSRARMQVHEDKFWENHIKLQQIKNEKAEEILTKHRQIRIRQKAYKQKEQKIRNTIMNSSHLE